jgi:hypothetical protein
VAVAEVGPAAEVVVRPGLASGEMQALLSRAWRCHLPGRPRRRRRVANAGLPVRRQRAPQIGLHLVRRCLQAIRTDPEHGVAVRILQPEAAEIAARLAPARHAQL